jgi:hypothetical protein
MKLEVYGPRRKAAYPFGGPPFGLRGLGSDISDCIDAGKTWTGTECIDAVDNSTGSGSSSSGSGTSSTPPFGGSSIANCVTYNAGGDCDTCASGYGVNAQGSCSALASSSGGSGSTNWSGLINSLTNAFKPAPVIAASGAAACAAAKGQWTGTQCAPASSVVIGGTAIPMTYLLIGAVALFVMARKR